jgi:hypothetical protein
MKKFLAFMLVLMLSFPAFAVEPLMIRGREFFRQAEQ